MKSLGELSASEGAMPGMNEGDQGALREGPRPPPPGHRCPGTPRLNRLFMRCLEPPMEPKLLATQNGLDCRREAKVFLDEMPPHLVDEWLI